MGKLKYILINILLGFGIVSSFSNYLFINILGVGFNAVELVLIPLVIVYRKKVTYNHLYAMRFISACIILFIISILSLNTSHDSWMQFSSILSTIRSFMLFALSLCVFQKTSFDLKRIYQILIFALCGDIIASIVQMQATMLVRDGEFAQLINVLICPLILSIAYKIRSKIEFTAVCAACLFSSFLSLTRGNVVYTILVILIIVCFDMKIKKVFKLLPLIAFLTFATYSIYISSEEHIRNISPSMHYRMYTKVLEHESAVTGDDDRLGHIIFICEHFMDCVVPRGFAPRVMAGVLKINEDRLLYSVRDCSLSELIYTLGILGYALPILLAKRILWFMKRRKKIASSYIVIPTLTTIFMYLFTGYGLLSFPPTVLLLGAILGYQSQTRSIYTRSL